MLTIVLQMQDETSEGKWFLQPCLDLYYDTSCFKTAGNPNPFLKKHLTPPSSPLNYICCIFDVWGLFFFIHSIFQPHYSKKLVEDYSGNEIEDFFFFNFSYFLVLICNWWRPKQRGISITVFKIMKLLRNVTCLYNLILEAFGIILNHWVSLNLKFPCMRILIKYCISDTVLDALIRNSLQIALWSFLVYRYYFLTLGNIQGK